MSGSAGNGNSKTIQQLDSEFMMWIGIAVFVIVAALLIWLYERQILTIPACYYMLPQLFLIYGLTGSQGAAYWIERANYELTNLHTMKTAPVEFFSGGFGYLGHTLWFLYTSICFLVFVPFFLSDVAEEFVGMLHPTGFEYVKEWRIGRGSAPPQIVGFLEAASGGKGGIIKKLIGTALLGLTRAKKEEVRKRTGGSFIEYQAKVWGLMKPIAVFDPFDCIDELGEVRRPEIWARDVGIVSERVMKEILSRTKNWRQSSPPPYNYVLAKKAFEAQVVSGGRWEGTYKLPPYMQALMVIFYLNRHDSQKTAIELCYECAGASVPLWGMRGNASRPQINAVKAEVNGHIKRILAGQHGNPRLPQEALLTPQIVDETDRLLRGFWWRRTGLISAYGLSGSHFKWGGGIYPIIQPALLGWVQAIDRTLYLALNCVGGETSHAECAGAIAQYHIERVFKRERERKLAALERDLANATESAAYAAYTRNLSIEEVGGEKHQAEVQNLQAQIDAEKRSAAREPELNVNGPLNWLDALVTTDRNEAGMDPVYAEPHRRG